MVGADQPANRVPARVVGGHLKVRKCYPYTALNENFPVAFNNNIKKSQIILDLKLTLSVNLLL